MKINAIKFGNFNLNINKANTFQARPMSLKSDTVEFSKNVSFLSKTDIFEKSLSREAILDKARQISKDVEFQWLDADRIFFNTQLSLRQDDSEPYFIQSFSTTPDIKGFVKKTEDGVVVKEYMGDDIFREMIQNKDSIIYRWYGSRGRYNEWLFDLNGNIESISLDVSIYEDVKEIGSRYTYINDKGFAKFESAIVEIKGKCTKIAETWEFPAQDYILQQNQK